MPCLHYSSGMPGFLDYGEEPVQGNVRGFLYYTGTELVRIYHLTELPPQKTLYYSDFGNAHGLTVTEAEKEFYEELKAKPIAYPDYSFVPEDEFEEIITPQNSLKLKHAFAIFTK